MPQRAGSSLVLKPLVGKLQRGAVLGNGPDNVVRSAGRNFRFDLKCDPNFGAYKAGQMRNHFVGNFGRHHDPHELGSG